MPPDYVVKYPIPPEKTSVRRYAVYASGLVRRIAAQEADYLTETLGLPEVVMTNADHEKRLTQVDSALRAASSP